jgi:uncharacterized membrane protein
MSNTHQQRYWLALLTAILLLMQSFAIWHDTEHAFHTAEEQCERFEAFGHTPTLDIIASVIPLQTTLSAVVETTPIAFVLPTRRYEAYTIRAPPHIQS